MRKLMSELIEFEFQENAKLFEEHEECSIMEWMVRRSSGNGSHPLENWTKSSLGNRMIFKKLRYIRVFRLTAPFEIVLNDKVGGV